MCVARNSDALNLPFGIGFFQPKMIYNVNSPVMRVFAFLSAFTKCQNQLRIEGPCGDEMGVCCCHITCEFCTTSFNQLFQIRPGFSLIVRNSHDLLLDQGDDE